jgi:hypothetical protein
MHMLIPTGLRSKSKQEQTNLGYINKEPREVNRIPQ